MKSKTAFTKKDILVVLGCIVFLLASIAAVGNSGRRRAKEAVCLSNLHQWGGIFERYTNDHDGYFYEGRGWRQHGNTSHEQNGWWMNALRPYYGDNWNLLLCPTASRVAENMYDFGTFCAYYLTMRNRYPAPNEGATKIFTASYGENSWVSYILYDQSSTRKVQFFWKNVNGVTGKNNIPVFADSAWLDAWPFDTDAPPPTPDFWQIQMGQGTSINELREFCLDRHNGGINMLFMDWSARKVGLKELWTLKWHREFNTQGPWTKAGGVQPEDWPEWMKNFKDF